MFLRSCFVALALVAVLVVGECPEGWELRGSFCYEFFFDMKRSWDDAQEFCWV